MNNLPQKAGGIFISSLLSVLKNSGKLALIGTSWALRFTGMFLLKFGEIIERSLLKVHR